MYQIIALYQLFEKAFGWRDPASGRLEADSCIAFQGKIYPCSVIIDLDQNGRQLWFNIYEPFDDGSFPCSIQLILRQDEGQEEHHLCEINLMWKDDEVMIREVSFDPDGLSVDEYHAELDWLQQAMGLSNQFELLVFPRRPLSDLFPLLQNLAKATEPVN